ncbi:MAG: hypothetical protein MOIL_00373 [Candidatus Methanolliviera sp. GoM_oil]|nr:MAG: hypothetical protein MOIL_00373 [Candidatus Methanolliviera sp. GoM_oil]
MPKKVVRGPKGVKVTYEPGTVDPVSIEGDEYKWSALGITEKQILEDFKNSGLIEGEFEEQVIVGKNSIEYIHDRGSRNLALNLIRKQINLVIENKNDIWIIEGKSKFDANSTEKALGQVLIYEELYKIDMQPKKNIKKAVVFGTSTWEEVVQQTKNIFEKYAVNLYIKGIDF